MSAHPRDWGAIKAIFQEAIELLPDERAAFLARACGDDTKLRAEVESLLASNDDERPFLEAAPIAGAGRVFADALDDANEPSTTELLVGYCALANTKCWSVSAAVAWATSIERTTRSSIDPSH